VQNQQARSSKRNQLNQSPTAQVLHFPVSKLDFFRKTKTFPDLGKRLANKKHAPAPSVIKNMRIKYSTVIQLHQFCISFVGIMLHRIYLRSYCAPEIVMSKLKLVTPLTLDETESVSTA
jgi:hypothetical protein